MSEVHKLVCDVCGKEKDLLSMQFGGVDTWQKLKITEPIGFPYVRGYMDLCSIECLKNCVQNFVQQRNFLYK